MQVWKYTLPNQTGIPFELEIPLGYQILDVQLQRGIPCLWVVVEPSVPKIRVTFLLVGTGQTFLLDNVRNYIGTYQQMDQQLVFHLFRMTED